MASGSGYIGKQIGNYRIEEELASGAFGRVYRGVHVYLTNRVVAIKLLHLVHLGSPQERESFLQEAQFLEMLKHLHILPILDVGIDDGFPYLVAEYAARGSLRKLLLSRPDHRLPMQEAVTILTQIGEALQQAHNQNIVHRDLKPENILFNAKGEALLADFGIATVIATAKTKQMGLGGTPSYIDPEQFEGIISMKSDQYALGCIAYELLTGQKPFVLPNPTLEAMWFHHSKVYPTAPIQLNPLIPSHVEQAIFKAIIKQRTERHADVAAFITALQKTAEQWFDEGIEYFEANRYEEALAALEQALRLNPNDAVAYANKGDTLYALKCDEEALVAYEQALCLDPNDGSAYYNKGIAFNALNRYEEALVAYEQVIRLQPELALAHQRKGQVLEKLGRRKEAQQAYAKARELGYKG